MAPLTAAGEKTCKRSPAILEQIARAEAIGWTVELREYCEDAETPGLLGQIAGVCVKSRRAIKVRVRGRTDAQIAAAIAHELEHAQGAERGTDRPDLDLRCGGTGTVPALRPERQL